MSDRTPLYPRLLRLRHVHPNGWQRAALGEGALALAAVLVLADLATAWTLLVLPLAVAAVVKGHDLVAGALARSPRRPAVGPGSPAAQTGRGGATGGGQATGGGRTTGGGPTGGGPGGGTEPEQAGAQDGQGAAQDSQGAVQDA